MQINEVSLETNALFMLLFKSIIRGDVGSWVPAVDEVL